jgi:vacuolar-type H+-ATPase subunit E/Vma4
MALADLLRALEHDAEARIAEVQTEAVASSARLRVEGRERLEHRRSAELATRETALQSESARVLETTRQDAGRRVLTARARALERIQSRARDLLLRTEPDRRLLDGIALEVGTALEYFGDSGAVVRCAPAWGTALTPIVARRSNVKLEATNGVGPGAAIRAVDGTLEIDATLETRLDRLWPRLAIDLVRELEAGR